MLRINPHRSSASAQRYYTGALTRQEYYSQNHDLSGEWAGRGTSKLGVKGEVIPELFAALCDNLHPQTRERLTLRQKSNRTIGYDFTFDPPKSVSVVHAIHQDPRLVAAFKQAVRSTMEEIEADAKTRVRVQNQDANRVTGNLVWAEFLHETTRPVDGIPDPQLHMHCFVFNATFDAAENRWKAGQFRDLKRDAPYYQAIFHSKLAALLEAQGYEIERRGAAFELAGISDALIDKFSRRTEQIEATARKRGITNPKVKSLLGAQTREPKRADSSAPPVQIEWQSRLSPEDLPQLERHRSPQPRLLPPSDPMLLANAIEYAKQYSFERMSVVDQASFIAAALRFSVGKLESLEIRAAIDADPSFVRRADNDRTLLTTTALIEEERNLVEWVRKGHGTATPLAPAWTPKDPDFADDLRIAAQHVLRSRDRVTGIRGRAGTGKTTLMKTTIAAIRQNGHKVVVLAPTAETGRGTLRENDFPNANTVAHLLANKQAQEEARGAVWWIDEAGLASVHDMTQLAALADSLDARLVLSGDSGQHRSVRRGDALRLFVDHAEVDLATLKVVRRQSGEYRETVEALSENRLREAFDKLEQMGALHEMSGPERDVFIASKYMEIRSKGESVLIVSPTHSESRKVTRLVRDKLKAAGQLADERTFPQLRRVDFRDADLRRFSNYEPGMIVEMVKRAPGHEVGKRYVVDSIIEGEVYVKHSDGSRRFFDVVEWTDRFQVFQQGEMTLAAGDRIRITKGGYDVSRKPLNNGSLHTIVGFTDSGDLRLDNDCVLDENFAHLEHGYVTTSHAAQSKTVKHVIVAESSESFPAASREQFYVSVSRGQLSATIVTDDKDALFESIQTSSQRRAALDHVKAEHVPAALNTTPLAHTLGAKTRYAAQLPHEVVTLPIARRPHM